MESDDSISTEDDRMLWRLLCFFGLILCALAALAALAAWDGASRKDLLTFFAAYAWPLVVILALIWFREPLTQLLRGIAPRLTKLSFMKVEFELKQAASLSHSAPAVINELQAPLSALAVQESGPELRAAFAETGSLVYVEIDLGKGDEWLTTRLYIMTALLPRLRGLRCVVFVETRDGMPRRFVGMATPDTLRWAMAMRWPYLEHAFAQAYASVITLPSIFVGGAFFAPRIKTLGGGLDGAVAQQTFQNFLSCPGDLHKRGLTASPNPIGEWVQLQDQQWERSEWVTGSTVKDILGGHLETSAIAHSSAVSPERLAPLVVKERFPFVATLHSDGSFKSAIDRLAVVSAIAPAAG
ncbi:MAG: hypothetical protein WDN28_31845 [Chthoniobacter sp.]